MTECERFFDVLSEIDWIGLFVVLPGLTYCCSSSSSWYSVKPSSRDFRDDYLFNASVWLFIMTTFSLGDWFAALGFLSQGVKMFFDFVAEVTYKPQPRIRRERNRWLSKNKRYSGKKWRAIHRSIAMHLAEKNKHRHRVSRRFYVNRAASTRRMLKLFKQWYYLNRICRPSVRDSTSWNAKNTAYNHSYASSFYQTIARGFDPLYDKHPVPDQKELLDFIDCGGVPLHLQGRFHLPSFSPVGITACAIDFVDHRHLLFLSYYYFEEDDSQVSTEAPSIDYVIDSIASSGITPFDNYLYKFLQEAYMHLQWNYIMKVWLKRWCLQSFLCSCTSTIFALIILLSLPVLVTAPNNAPTAGTSSIPTAASAVGTGIAAATSCALAVNAVYSHRTRQWTEVEKRLKERCRKYGVEYTPPSPDENEEKEHERRARLEQECETKRTKVENRLKNKCRKYGVEYTPPSPDENEEKEHERRTRLEQECKTKQKELRQSKDAENKRKRRKLESSSQKRKRNAQNAQRMQKSRAALTEEDRAEVRRKAKEYQRQRKAAEDRRYEEDGTIFIGKDRTVPFIEVSLEGVKEARRLLTRTAVDDDDDDDPDNKHHRAIGCVVCDEFIIGTEKQCGITKDHLLKQRDRLGVESYEEFHGEIDDELQKQYEIKGLEGLLLSRRFGKDGGEKFTICSRCQKSLYSSTDNSPPKYAIANGFAIGTIPETIDCIDGYPPQQQEVSDESRLRSILESGDVPSDDDFDGVWELAFRDDMATNNPLSRARGQKSIKTVLEHRDGDGNVTSIKESKITSIMAAALSRKRPYAYIFAYHGGQHKSLMGNFQFFETSQTKIAGALNCLNQSGMTSNLYVVINGRMTPTQKEIVRKKAELDTDLYFALLRWLKAHHPGYQDVEIDESSNPKVELIEDPDSDANTDKDGDKDVEKRDDGATFFFSSGGDPTREASVYKTSKELVLELLKGHTAPTLTIQGGEYVGFGEVMKLEDVFPTAFPFGSGGPTVKRRNTISDEEIIRHYLRLSLPQFMESEFVLVANFLVGRIRSYKTATMRVRPIINTCGTAVADEIGKMSIVDIEKAIEEENSGSGRTRSQNSTASKFLQAVSASCRELGHTKEAAQQARRRCFALQEYFGMHSLFVTITVDDECSFRVRLYPFANGNGEGIPLPSLNSSDAECIADLTLRRRVRRKFPGACSLEFQSAMQIALECMFGWDPARQKGKPGIFGTMEAYCRADEEQGRLTLHAHWLVWIKHFGELRRLMFAEDEQTRKVARASYISYINKVMSVAQCDFEADVTTEVTQKCSCGRKGKVDEMYENCDSSIFRQARHEKGCTEIKGKVMQCRECKAEISTSDVTDEILRTLQEEDSVTSFPIPISKERLDILAYRTVYDHDVGGNDNDPDAQLRFILLNKCCNQHCAMHARSCFKKGCECRFCLPCLATLINCILQKSDYEGELDEEHRHLAGDLAKAMNSGTRIYEGENPIDVERHTLDGRKSIEQRFTVEVRRPQGCQFMNTYNVWISRVFTCNSNVAAGDSGQTFYQTLYEFKNTQKDDREARDLVAKNVIRRLLRAQEAKEELQNAGGEIEEEVNTWVEGLSRVLSGINAATSRAVISAPMSHNLALNKGLRFHFGHQFAELLVGQMEDKLDEKQVSFILRRCSENEVMTTWEDISANDYLFRPATLEDHCFFHQTMLYTKQYKQKGHNDLDDSEAVDDEMKFGQNPKGEDHPGDGFAYLAKLKHPRIPIASIPEGKLCPVQELDLNNANPTEITKDKRDNYAKMALLMFCPFRELKDLKRDGSYWQKFDAFRNKYFSDEHPMDNEGYVSIAEPNSDGEIVESKFWMKGFDILQNMEDRMAVEKCQGRAVDVVTDKSDAYVVENATGTSSRSEEENDDCSVKSISYYCDGCNSDYASDDEDYEEDSDRYTHGRLIDRELNTTKDRLLDARLTSTDPIISGVVDTTEVDGAIETAATHQQEVLGNTSEKRSNHTNVLRLIRGSLLGGDGTYQDVYAPDSDDNTTETIGDVATKELVPTLRGVARLVQKEENKRLDEKQYIMYEVIACSFLLGLLHDETDEDEQSLHLQNLLRTATGEEIINETKALKNALEARGGREQLIMFVTGFAGAGKSTAIKVAQRFCFEFCRAAGIMWSDNTFMFTAYTGSAAAAFGGQTTVSATYIGKKTISDDDIKAYHGVRTIIIDEVSFLTDKELRKLDKNLQRIGDSQKPFGGYDIIFAGDFQQNEPVKMKTNEKLWHPSSSRHFENNINCCIILDGLHRFKDDEEYGRILQRLCSGELSEEDVQKINSRFVGRDGVKVPRVLEGDSCYACSTNSERNALAAAIFRNHLQATHPDAGSDEDPPKHTLIIKGLIQSSSKKIDRTLYKRIIELGDCDMKQGTKLISPHLCCYNGAYFMCNSNDGLKEHGTANGSQARLISVKLVDDPQSYKCEVWDNKKVWTVNASDVEFVEFEHHPQRNGKSKRFQLKPKKMSVEVKVSPHDVTNDKVSMKCSVTQIPVNASDAITGHKLQGLTKDNVIVVSWNKSTNWIYVVLSRVRKLSGLYLFRKLKLKDIKPPQSEYLDFLRRMRAKEEVELNRSRRAMRRGTNSRKRHNKIF